MAPVTGRRRLIVMRHAKAEPFASTDHARSLTDRGRADAAGAGTFIAAHQVVPDHALVSTADRTRETWAAVAKASDAAIDASYDETIYHGDVDTALESVQAVPADANTVILIGHNPAAAYLCHLLDDGHGDAEAMDGMLQGFPTSALVVFDVDVAWADLAAETGTVTAFHAPSH